MSNQAIIFAREGPLFTARLNRAERLNALNSEMIDLFEAQLLPATRDPEVRAILITGTGRGFCAGGDVGTMGGAPNRDASRDAMRRTHRWLAALRASHAIVITAVNGPAAGGGFGLAMIGDLVIASDAAFFKAGFTNLGVAIDYGLGWTLPQAVGSQRAAEIIFTERRISAEEAHRIGMVARLFPADTFEDDAIAFARQIAGAPYSARISKQLLQYRHPEFLRYLEAEAEGQADAFQTRDFREGSLAFLERRPPRFAGA
jgi:2-(1,2-epoxy-1,2-dihydrophenyl)acetyl-CoA isomerase